MRYSVSEVLSQLVGVLKHSASLSGVSVNVMPWETYDAESGLPEVVQYLVDLKKFVMVQYAGKSTRSSNNIKNQRIASLKFRVLVGGSDVVNLETTRKAVLSNLANVYDALNGKFLKYAGGTLASGLDVMENGSGMVASVWAPVGQLIEVGFSDAHGLTTGDKITLWGVDVATLANNTSGNLSWTVTVIDSTAVTLDGSVGDGTTSSNGKWVNAITSSEFMALTPVTEAEGDVESIVNDYPGLLVYESMYVVDVMQ